MAIWSGSIAAAEIGLTSLHSLSTALFLGAALSAFTFGVKNRTAVLLMSAMICGLLTYALHSATVKNNVVTRIAIDEKDLQVIGEVIRDPVISNHGMNFVVRTSDVMSSTHHWHVRVPVRVWSNAKDRESQRVTLGETLALHGRIALSRERNIAAIFYSRSIDVRRPAPAILSVTQRIRTQFRNIAAQFSSDAGALVPGMVLGDTSLQSQDFTNHMRRVGLTHITAVSGANFALVASFVLWLTQWWIRTIRIRIMVTGAVLCFFILLVRPSPSVLRATVMCGVLLVARARGGNSSSASALGAAVTFLLLLDPFQAVEPGFVLSVLATAGILFLAPVITRRFSNFLPVPFAEAIAIPTSATTFCTPVIVALSGQISLVTIPVNLLVAPFIGPITVGGFLAAIIATISSSLAHHVMDIVIIPTQFIVVIAHFASHVPVLGASPGLALWAIALVIALFFRRGRRVMISSSVILVAITIIFPLVRPLPSWRIYQCDVGQGDALVYQTGKYRAIVIDTGPDPQLIDHCLSQLKINEIDLLVITHSHADHAGGIAGVLHHRIVHEVWANSDVAMNFAGIVNRREVHAGERFIAPPLTITVLWPEQKDFTAPTLPGDGSVENNKSIVLLIENHGVTLLTTGDIEPPAQAEIARRFASHIDVLKIAHHGSRYQDFRWLESMKPSVSLISVGKDNSYGHPAEITIRDLARIGSSIHRTDRDGGIAIDWSYDSQALKFRIRHEVRLWWKVRLR